MIKYTKVEDATESMEDLEMGKVLLWNSDDPDGEGEIRESPWVKKMSDGRQILQNHALCFHPFPSWGMIIPKGKELDMGPVREAREFPLHPEAYAMYEEQGIIDADGNFIEPEKREGQEG